MNGRQILKLFPEPYPFALRELECGFFIDSILEGGNAGDFCKAIDLPRFSFPSERADSGSREITEPQARQCIKFGHRPQNPQIWKTIDMAHEGRLCREFHESFIDEDLR